MCLVAYTLEAARRSAAIKSKVCVQVECMCVLVSYRILGVRLAVDDMRACIYARRQPRTHPMHMPMNRNAHVYKFTNRMECSFIYWTPGCSELRTMIKVGSTACHMESRGAISLVSHASYRALMGFE